MSSGDNETMPFAIRTLILTAFVFTATAAPAAQVLQVKVTRALLDISGLDNVIKGDELVSVDNRGKRAALLKVQQIKGKRAIAEVVRGNPQVGQAVNFRSGRPSISRDLREADFVGDGSEEEDIIRYRMQLRRKYTGRSWGVLGQYLQTTMSAAVSTGSGFFQQKETANMTGSAFGVVGYYDWPILRNFHFRVIGGYEPFNAAGSTSIAGCGGGTTCDFKVTYLTTHGQAKFNFYEKQDWRAWVYGGYGFMFAMSKSSTVIESSQISPAQMFSFGIGLDMPMGRKNYIPLAIDYGLFPSTETVKTNTLTLRAGYAWLL